MHFVYMNNLFFTTSYLILVVWHFGGHGGNKKTPFKKCGSKQGCPSIRNGPFGGEKYTHSYHLLQLEFHWGSMGDNSKGSEHVLDGKR